MSEIALLVNNKRYGGWKTARVTRGIESVSGSFELSVSDRWQAGSAPWAIYEEDECTVSIGAETLVTGYVDRRSVSYSPGEHSLSVSGRDRTGDLVDCSAVLGVWEFHNTPVLDLVQKVAKPFGVAVSLARGITLPAPEFRTAIDPGESAFNVVERLCKKAGVLPVSDGKGGLTLMRPGSARCTTELVEEQNILAASADFDVSGRFRRYVVLGQHTGSDAWFGAETSVRATAEDAGVKRTARVLLVRPEGSVSGAQAKRRAEWEATVRAARADAVSVTVQGWTQGDGSLWPVNALVRVRSPRLGIDGDLLVSQADYEVGEGGTTTRLTLRRPDAFKPEPQVRGDGLWKEIAKGV